MISRIIYLGLISAAMAVFTHIVIVLLVPAVGSKDAARQIMNALPTHNFVPVSKMGDVELTNVDPFMNLTVCRFDLTQDPVSIEAEEVDLFWTASVFTPTGEVLYSFNKTTAIGKRLRMVIVDAVQLAQLRQVQPEIGETAIIVESAQETGFIVVRVLKRDESRATDVLEFTNGIACEPFPLGFGS